LASPESPRWRGMRRALVASASESEALPRVRLLLWGWANRGTKPKESMNSILRHTLLVSVILFAHVSAAWANVGNVVIGAPKNNNGVYELNIDYIDAAGTAQNFKCKVASQPPDTAVIKRDNLLAACTARLTNLGINDFTLAAGGGTSIN